MTTHPSPQGLYNVYYPNQKIRAVHGCHDPQTAINTCLDCPLPDCRPKSSQCPIRQLHKAKKERKP